MKSENASYSLYSTHHTYVLDVECGENMSEPETFLTLSSIFHTVCT